MKLGEQCDHGQLKRQCPLCEKDAEIAELRAENERNAEQVHELATENEGLRADLHACQEQLDVSDRDRMRLQARGEEMHDKYLDCQDKLARVVGVAKNLLQTQGYFKGNRISVRGIELYELQQALAALEDR